MTKSKNYKDGRPFEFSEQKTDLTNAYVRIIYNDGYIVEPLSKHYKTFSRKNMKKAVIVSSDHRPLYTLDIKNDEFGYRKRSIAKPFDTKGRWHFDTPKRCIVLATKGKVVFFWDSEEIKEFSSWQNDAIYNQRNMKEVDV